MNTPFIPGRLEVTVIASGIGAQVFYKRAGAVEHSHLVQWKGNEMACDCGDDECTAPVIAMLSLYLDDEERRNGIKLPVVN